VLRSPRNNLGAGSWCLVLMLGPGGDRSSSLGVIESSEKAVIDNDLGTATFVYVNFFLVTRNVIVIGN